MQRPTHIWQQPLRQKHNGRVVSIRRHLLRLLMTWGLNLLDSSVNQSVSKRLFQYICPLVHLSVRFSFGHCKDKQNLSLAAWFLKKSCWKTQKSADFVKYYGKLCGFMRWQCCQGSAGYWKKTRIGSNHPLSLRPMLTSNLLKRRQNRYISADFTIETCSNGLFSLSLCPCKATK